MYPLSDLKVRGFYRMLEKLLNRIKVSDPLALLIVISGNIIVALALMVKWYPQIIPPILQSNNHYLMVAVGLLLLVLATFFGAVELYIGRGIVRWMNRQKRERAARNLIRNLPPLYKAILRKLMLYQNYDFDEYNPRIASALSDLESYGFIQGGSAIPPIYHISLEYYAFFRENLELLDNG